MYWSEILTEMYWSFQYLSIDQKKVCRQYLSIEPKKVWHAHADSSETIKDGELGFQI